MTACQPANEEPAAEEPAAEEPAEEEPAADAPAEEEPAAEEAMETPTSVQFCILYASSITDSGWDRSGHEIFQAPILFGVPEIELDLKAQTIKVDDLFIGEFQVA